MNAPVQPPLNVDKYVGAYVKLRDKIKEIEAKNKEELAPYKETLEKLNSVLLGHLNTIGADNVGTSNGTVYKKLKKSASIADATAFWAWVVTNGEFDMIDKRANVQAVEAYIQEHGEAPPGINWSAMAEVGVQRK